MVIGGLGRETEMVSNITEAWRIAVLIKIMLNEKCDFLLSFSKSFHAIPPVC